MAGNGEPIRSEERESPEKTYREVLHFITHEFENSLTVISGLARRLLRDEDDRERAKQMRIIAEQADHLETMCADLLVMSRLEEGRAELNEERIEDVFAEVVLPEAKSLEQLHPTSFPGYTGSLPQTEGVAVRGDPRLVQTVFRNLLSNAFKYGDRKQPIRLDVNERNGMYQFTVWNSGHGIRQADRDRIFEKFFRSSEECNSGQRGTGLGLYNVRLIVEAHGGRIWCESREGEGTGMVFTLKKASG